MTQRTRVGDLRIAPFLSYFIPIDKIVDKKIHDGLHHPLDDRDEALPLLTIPHRLPVALELLCGHLGLYS